MEIKNLIESIIYSLTNGDDISNIMLKTQAVAYYLANEDFKRWVNLEQNGYGENDNIPEYRKIVCGVKIKVFVPFKGEQIISIPINSIPNKEINKHLYFIGIKQSLKEIESLISLKCENHHFHTKLSASIFGFFKPVLRPDVSVQDAWQYAEISSLEKIIDNVKSLLLNFFLKLDNEIDLNKLDNTQKINTIMNQTINAGIINTGSGHIEVNNSTVIGGSESVITMDSDLKRQIESVLKQIEEIKGHIAEDEADIAKYIFDIRQELNKERPSGMIIKTSLRALKSFGTIVTSKVIELGLDKLISAISL